jgi:chromosome segregation ATPase
MGRKMSMQFQNVISCIFVGVKQSHRSFMRRKGFLVVCLTLVSGGVFAATSTDSILQQRYSIIEKYKALKESGLEGTWVNLYNETKAAADLIELDNLIITEYIKNDLSRLRALREENARLQEDIKALRRQVEESERTLREKERLKTILFMVSAGILLLFLIFLTVFIDRHLRYRRLRLESQQLTGQHAEKEEQIKKLSSEAEELRDLLGRLKAEKEDGAKSRASLEESLQTAVAEKDRVSTALVLLQEDQKSLTAELEAKEELLLAETRRREKTEARLREIISDINNVIKSS